jgi:spore coat polysaccharide biosynthesis protein SpsF
LKFIAFNDWCWFLCILYLTIGVLIMKENSIMCNYDTIQENFWAGEFGDNYIDRNLGEGLVASNTALFAKVLRYTRNVQSILELGANIGLNLMAIHPLLPPAKLTGVEINTKASEIMARLNYVEVINSSFYNLPFEHKYDFVFTKGVLIHQNPDMLQKVYELLYNVSSHYIFICEYYNPVPVELKYRGHESVMFKRDFAGEIMDKYPDLKLIDYGFVYHKDNNFSGDDLNWFLIEK